MLVEEDQMSLFVPLSFSQLYNDCVSHDTTQDGYDENVIELC